MAQRANLSAERAPDMQNEPDYCPDSLYVWRPVEYDQAMEQWRVGETPNKEFLMTRMAQPDGTWVDEEAEHECLPDFSCCEPSIAWELDVRDSFMKASDQERSQFLMQSLSALASTTDVKIHVADSQEYTLQ